MPSLDYDIFIYNAQILTMNSNFDDYLNGYILIKDSKIVEIGSLYDLEISVHSIDAKEVIDAKKGIIIPGLINSHSHFAMSLFRGLADDLSLHEWLNNYIWPLEANLQEECCYIGTKLAIAEMILSGTTSACDMYFYEPMVLKALEEIGFRGILGHGMLDFNNKEKRKKELLETENLISQVKNKAKLCSVIVSPHAPNTCSEELLIQAKQLAVKNNLPLQIHLAETKKEYDDIYQKKSKSPTKYLYDIDFLCNRLVAAHAIWLDKNDYSYLKQCDVKIAHNLTSNLKLASGILNINEYLKNNIVISLGTDSAASNNNLSMFNEMRLCSLLHKGVNKDPTILPAKTILQMATVNGAKALGLEKIVGSLEVGKQADLIIVDTGKPHLWPRHDPYSLLVYAASDADVNTSIINGHILMKEKQLLTIDLPMVLTESQSVLIDLLESTKLDQFKNKQRFLL